jgi:uncharacterized protein (TIGR02145 family)
MEDTNIWMIQDIKFGNCDKTDYTGSDSNTGNQYDKLFQGSYGDCRNNPHPGAGYLYDWAAVMQKPDTYSGGSETGCNGNSSGATGKNPATCQGICPAGWHIPTSGTASNDEYYGLFTAPGRNCETKQGDCWNSNSAWEGVAGGLCDASGLLKYFRANICVHSSTYQNTANYLYLLSAGSVNNTHAPATKSTGMSARCVMNY